jgi:hypothetical protein
VSRFVCICIMGVYICVLVCMCLRARALSLLSVRGCEMQGSKTQGKDARVP